MSKQDTENWIEKYLAGKLDEKEQVAFEKKLKEDPEFKKLFDHYQNIKKSIAYKDRIEFLSKLEEAESKYFNKRKKKPGKPGGKGLMFSLAAVTLLLISTVLYLVFKEGQRSGQELYNQYFSPFNQVIEYRSGSDEGTHLQEGMILYRQGNLDEAIEAFRKAAQDKEQQSIANFYLGMVYMGKGEAKNAIPLLEEISQKQHELKETAEWYLSLAYLKEGKTANSQKMLEKIAAQQGHYYSLKAERLIGDMTN